MMNVTELLPSAVLHDFSSRGEAVRQLYRKDKGFQAICFDYQQCARALHYWSNSDLPSASQRRKEYQDLLSELRAEISLILNRMNTSETNNDRHRDL
jgi:hypothetical protein